MRKLYKIKQTYSIGEAAERLSLTLGDQITPDEVLQLMADGEIGIFWWIGDDYARPVAPFCKLRDDDGYTLGPSRGFISNPAAGEVQRITGVFRICTEIDPEAKNWARRKCAGIYDDIPWEGTIVCDPDGGCWELMKHKYDSDSRLIYEADRKYPLRDELIITKFELDRFELKFLDDSGIELMSPPSQKELSAENGYELQHRSVLDAKLILLEKSLRDAKAETDWVRKEFAEATVKDELRVQEERDRYRTLNEQLATEVSRLTEKLGLANGNPESVSASDWTKPYIGRATISLADASAILAGFAPIYGYDNRSENAWRKIDPWCKALVDAVDNSREISGASWGNDRSEQAISHADIRAWCVARGHTWPIPELDPQPTIHDANMGERLRAAEEELAVLRVDSAALKEAADIIDELKDQLERKEGELREAKDSLAGTCLENERLKADQVQGKSRTTMLQIIGGLILANTDMKIHTNRLDGLSKMLVDLQTVGVTVGEDTMRSYLQSAATLIDRRDTP